MLSEKSNVNFHQNISFRVSQKKKNRFETSKHFVGVNCALTVSFYCHLFI